MRKKTFKKVSAVMLAVATVCAAITGCGGSKTNSNGGNSGSGETKATAVEVTEPITITLWHASGSGANGDYMDAVVKAFNETNEYGITVETMYVEGYDAILSKVSTALAGNEAPELAMFADQGIPVMDSKGVFADLSAYVERDNFDLSNFISAVEEYVNQDGRVITVPFSRSTPVLMYNKAIWEKAGLTPSADLTELYQQAETISKANPGVYGFGTFIDPFYFQEPYVRSLGSDGLLADDGESPAALDDGNLEKVLSEWLAGIEAGYIAPPSVTDAQTKLREQFYNGKLASFIGSSGGLVNVAEMAKENNVDMGVTYYPSYGGSASGCGGNNLAVIGKGKSDQQIAAAWEFIKFVSSDEWVVERAIATGYIPVTKTAAATEKMQNYWTEHPEFKIAYDQTEYARCATWSVQLQEWNKYLNTAFSYVIQDKSMSPKEAVSYLEKQSLILFE